MNTIRQGIIAFLIHMPFLALAVTPLVTDIVAMPRSDSPGMIDVAYGLSDVDSASVTVTMRVSDNKGKTYALDPVYLSGDVGLGIRPGKDKRIVWNAGKDLPEGFSEKHLVTITASDSEPDSKIVFVNLPGLPTDVRPMRLVRIPTGSFLMGNAGGRDEACLCDACACELPRHEVILDADFYIGETEVTQGQWEALMGSNPAKPNADKETYGVGPNYPVYNISWDEIHQPDGFLNRLEGLCGGECRLPTEAEWEYACRGSENNPNRYAPFYFGDEPTVNMFSYTFSWRLDQYMWWGGNNKSQGFPDSPFKSGSKPVALKQPNDYGLYDMHGNVWEWCEDWWQEDFYSAPEAVQPSPVCRNDASGIKVMRGGSWGGLKYCRSASRDGFYPEICGHALGLRVVYCPPERR